MAPATKRAAPKAPASPARASKVAKKDHFGEACEAILALVEQDASLTDAARSMMRSATPFALRSSKEERHSYQTTIITALAEVISRVEAEMQAKSNGLETKVGAGAAEKTSVESVLAAAKANEVSKMGAQEEAQKLMTDAKAAIPEAKKAVAEAQKAEADLEKQHEAGKASKAEREQLLADTWVKLKEGVYPGNTWHQRKKSTDIIVAVLDGLEVENSLKLALPVALKSKAEERGIFGQKSVEAVEAILQKSVQDLEAKLGAHESTVAAAKAAIAQAEEKLQLATAQTDDKANAFIAAENALVTVTDEVNTQKDNLKKIMGSHKKDSAELAAAKGELSVLASLQAQLDALIQGGAAAAEPKAPEPEPAEDVVMVEERAESPGAEAVEAE